MSEQARVQAKIDMEQKFIDAIAYSEVELTEEEVNECFRQAKISAKETE